MFKKILLPVDLTDKHQTAMATATALARQNDGEVILLHVVELIGGLAQGEEEDFYRRLEHRARNHLARLATHLSQAQVHWRGEVIFGNRATETAGFAANHETGFIVLTAPSFQPEHPTAGFGSMAWRISLIAPCPVLLVRNPK